MQPSRSDAGGAFSPNLGRAILDAVSALERATRLAGQTPLADEIERLEIGLVSATLRHARRNAGVPVTPRGRELTGGER